jgi:hypothetical protein
MTCSNRPGRCIRNRPGHLLVRSAPAKLIVPAKDTTGLHPPPVAARCTTDYPCFSPVGYAIDTVIPLINIHQAEYWRPNANAPTDGFCTSVGWAPGSAGHSPR